MEFDLGSSVVCTDGGAGRIVGLIADPVRRSLAHIAVEPEHDPGRARLVPVDLVMDAGATVVELGCTLGRFRQLPQFRDIEFVPEGVEYDDPGADFAWPAYGLATRRVAVLMDRIPAGEVEIRHREHVRGTDGAIGRVEGLIVDDAGHITHVLLEEGHLWGRKEVAIPVASLARIDAQGIHVRLSKREIADLPELVGSRREEAAAS